MVLRVIQQSIDRISTGVAKRLKRICSKDNDFLEQSKNIQLTWPRVTISKRRLSELFNKFNKQSRSIVPQKRWLTTSSNQLVSNINSIIKKHLPIITDNPNLIGMFPKDSIFRVYKSFPSLKDIMVTGDS